MRSNHSAALLITAIAVSGCAAPRQTTNYSHYTGSGAFQAAASPTAASSYDTSQSLLGSPPTSVPVPVGNGKSIKEKFVASGGPKGDFESSEAYRARITNILPSAVSFSIPMDRSFYTYDADTQILKLNHLLSNGGALGFKSSSSGVLSTYPTINMGGDVEFVDKFAGQNSFGATAVVDRVIAQQYLLVLGALDYGKAGVARLTGTIHIDGPEMQRSASKLRLVVEGATVDPYVETSGEVREATIATKQQSIIKRYFFRVNASKIRIVNEATGVEYPSDISLTASRY